MEHPERPEGAGSGEPDSNELGYRNVSEERAYDERGDQGQDAGEEPVNSEQPEA